MKKQSTGWGNISTETLDDVFNWLENQVFKFEESVSNCDRLVEKAEKIEAMYEKAK
jgi:hypothetical protein